MAAHSLAITKASLAASLMRPDPRSVHRDEIAQFHELLDNALSQCSPPNIQRCKTWLLKNTLLSAARTTAVGKYLVALAASLGKDEEASKNGAMGATRVSGRRKQLHILYLLNDILHDSRYHGKDLTAYSTVTGNLPAHIADIFNFAAGYDAEAYPRQNRRLGEILDEWDAHRYFHETFMRKLRAAVEGAGRKELDDGERTDMSKDESGASKAKRDAPFIMPATHGDPAAPYYDLPAGNMMPHIIPNSPSPINTALVKPLQFPAGPADSRLTAAVQSLLKEVDVIYGQPLDEDEGISLETDDIGQPVYHDKATGEVVSAESYYGWSKDFCAQMKRKKHGRGRRSRSSSGREYSVSPRKRRRYSSSPSSSRSRSASRSRSPLPKFQRRRSQSRSRSPRRPYARSCSRTPSRHRSHSRSSPPYARYRSSSRGRSRSYSPPSLPPQDPPPSQFPHPPPPPQQQRQQFQHHPQRYPYPVPPPPQPPGQHFPQTLHPMPFASQFPHGIPLGPNGQAVPPPRPPNWEGPWPPPPPPPPPQSGSPGMGWQQGGFAPPPPPAAIDPRGGNGYQGHGGQAYGYGDGGRGRGRGRGGRWH